MKDNLKKNFIWNLVGSTVNSFTSLFFLIVVARLNGVNDAGIFTFAFSNACVLQVIGIYAGRSYQVTEKDKKIKDNDYVHNRIITCIIMVIIGILFVLIKKYNFYKLIVILLLIIFKALDAFSESLYGIIQKNRLLYQVGISLFMKGILGIIIFIIADLFTNNIIISCICLIIVNVIIIIFYDFKNTRKCNYYFEKIKIQNVIRIFKYGFCTFLFMFLTQFLINEPKYAIDTYLINKKQTIYGIISMPATIMILMSNLIIQPFILKISTLNEEKNLKGINSILFKMTCSIIIIGLIACLFAYIVGIPILNVLYSINLNEYLIDLILIIIGATIYAITIIISNILIAIRKTFSQVVIFLISSFFSIIISRILVKSIGIDGACLAYLFSMLFLVLLYVFLYCFIIRKINQGKQVVK